MHPPTVCNRRWALTEIEYILSASLHVGSGSTYIYGYCDAHFKQSMTKEECIEFVKTCKTSFIMT